MNTNDSLEAVDENIELSKMLYILSKQKRVIIIINSIFILAALLCMLLVRPVYESRTVIAIGKQPTMQQPVIQAATQQPVMQAAMQQPTLIEEPLLLVQRIKEKYRVGDTTEPGSILPALVTVDIDKKIATNNVIVLKAHAYTPKEAQEFLNEVVTPVIDEHQKNFSELKLLQTDRLRQLQQEINDIEEENAEYTRQSRLLASQDGAMAALLLMEKNSRNNYQAQLIKQSDELKSVALDAKIRPTTILKEPTLPVSPVNSKSIMMILIIILGIIFSLMVVLIKEYFAKTRMYCNKTDLRRS